MVLTNVSAVCKPVDHKDRPEVSKRSYCAVCLQLHAISLALFASVIAPFGGFFASGFKRSFKIKDFGDSIPGHGGMTDRMDCQVSSGPLPRPPVTSSMHIIFRPALIEKIGRRWSWPYFHICTSTTTSLKSRGCLLEP